MSVSSIQVIMDRIASATETSPIAVFKVPEKCGKLEAVFGATVMTQKKITEGDPDLVGVFHKGMDRFSVKSQLASVA